MLLCTESFSNIYPNKTVSDIEGVSQQIENVNNSIAYGGYAAYSEPPPPWAIYLVNRWADNTDERFCSEDIISFNWVLTAAHCKGYN